MVIIENKTTNQVGIKEQPLITKQNGPENKIHKKMIDTNNAKLNIYIFISYLNHHPLMNSSILHCRESNPHLIRILHLRSYLLRLSLLRPLEIM
jgi:hypothetical protein